MNERSVTALVVVLVTCLFGSVGLYLRSIAPPEPQGALARRPGKEADVGTIWLGIPTVTRVRLRNRSRTPITLTECVFGCSCVRARMELPLTIRPGEIQVVPIVWDGTPVGGAGESFRVRFSLTDSQDISRRWILTGEQRILFDPPLEQPLRVAPGGWPVRCAWEIHPSKDIRVASIRCEQAGWAVQLNHSDDDRVARITLGVQDPSEITTTELTLRVCVEDRATGRPMASALLPVLWEPFFILPQNVEFGALPVDTEQEQTVTLCSRDFVIHKVECSVNDGSTRLAGIDIGHDGAAEIRIRQRMARAGTQQAGLQLIVHFGSARQRLFAVRRAVPIN